MISKFEQTDCKRIFCELAKQWKTETNRFESITRMAMHPAYQKIIGMGEKAIPLLLAELKKKPDHWFWALEAITGADPVLDENRGDIDKMAEAWISWGKENRFEW